MAQRGRARTRRGLSVLIVSATVGAGDVGNARELARRLEEQGHRTTVRDFLEAAPLRLGKVLAKGYEAELRHAPWAYELAFSLWYWLPFLLRPLSRLLSAFTRRALARWVREARADVVVSTYCVATQALGDMRRRARSRWPWARHTSLAVPLVNCVTDFGYHPFWAHRHVDLNLAANPDAAARLSRRTGRASVACEPLVAPAFATAAHRRELERQQLGLQNGEVAVLVSSGSWGVGAVKETMEHLALAPDLVPVVACGHNSELRRQLTELTRARGYRALPLGWTDDMPGLMAACDVLVENAGGLTCFEAMRAGLPLVSFKPIPGHGRKSAAAMAAAGVSCLARAENELVGNLRRLGRPGPARRAVLEAGGRLFRVDAAHVVADVGASGPPPLLRLRPAARLARAAYALATAGALAWSGMTSGVGVAVAAGVGVAHPHTSDPRVVYVGVRLSPSEVDDPAVQVCLAHLHASAVVDLSTAQAVPAAVSELTQRDIGVESGGASSDPGGAGTPSAPWAVAQSDSRSVRALSALSGQPIAALVPNRSLSAFDLVDAGSGHFNVVVPDYNLPMAPSGPYPRDEIGIPALLEGGKIYLVDGLQLSPVQLVAVLGRLGTEESAEHLAGAPLSWLQ